MHIEIQGTLIFVISVFLGTKVEDNHCDASSGVKESYSFLLWKYRLRNFTINYLILFKIIRSKLLVTVWDYFFQAHAPLCDLFTIETSHESQLTVSQVNIYKHFMTIWKQWKRFQLPFILFSYLMVAGAIDWNICTDSGGFKEGGGGLWGLQPSSLFEVFMNVLSKYQSIRYCLKPLYKLV